MEPGGLARFGARPRCGHSPVEGPVRSVFGRTIYRWRWGILAAWLLAAAGLLWLGGHIDPAANEPKSLLPPDAPSLRTSEKLRSRFDDAGGLSEAVVVFERPDGPLRPGDRAAIERVAEELRGRVRAGGPLSGARVSAPGDASDLERLDAPNPLLSQADAKGQAALVFVSIPSGFVSTDSVRAVDAIREELDSARPGLPDGLDAAVTGASAYGRDYAAVARKSHEQTLRATLVAVLVILLIVHRAPLAAAVPLAAISIAAVVALKLLALLGGAGLHVGTAERIFVFVLLYGAGIDYSLLFLGRYREMIATRAHRRATPEALNATFGAVFASAVTDTCGLLMLCFARHAAFRTTGPAVAVALVTALLASVTLVPALVGVLGPRVFWPSRPRPGGNGRRLWPRVARAVVRRPGLVLVVTLAVLAAPAIHGASLDWVYDTLAEISPQYGSARGQAMVRRHWPVGATAPVTVLLEADREADRETWRERSSRVARELRSTEGVAYVRSMAEPFGGREEYEDLYRRIRHLRTSKDQFIAAPAALRERLDEALARWETGAEGRYLGKQKRSVRLEAVLNAEPFSREAMATVERIRVAAERAAGEAGPAVEIHITGATARMLDVRAVTAGDFLRVGGLVLAVIFVVVLAMLRRPVLAAFMVGATVVSYLATLGVAHWVFSGLLGAAGLDWKVQVFLFVVMVAVGVDYSIFLAHRVFQEALTVPVREATERAVIHTGPVISSCGVIMAATLGSLMAGELGLLHQLGFATALGMLIDTFVIRPLLLPAFIVLLHRQRRP